MDIDKVNGFASGLTKLDDAVLTNARDMAKMGKTGDELYQTLVNGTKASGGFANSLKGIGKQLGAVAINIVITLAIEALIKVISLAVNHEKELAANAQAATTALKEQRNAIDNYVEEAKKLYEVTNSNTSSQEELIEAKSRLGEIQRDLIKQYGDEASEIDLTTNSIKAQTKAIEDLEKLKYSDTLQQEFENNINKETGWQKFVNGLSKAGYIGKNIPTLGIPALLDQGAGWELSYQDAFGSNLDKMREKYEDFSTSIRVTSDETLNQLVSAYENVELVGGRFVISGNVEEVQDTIKDIQTRLQTYEGYTNNFNNALTKAYNKAKDISDEFGETYNEDMMYRISNDADATKFYNELKDAYSKVILDSSDEVAYQAYNNIVKQIEGSELPNAIKNGIIGAFDTDALNRVKFDALTDKISESGEDGLAQLTDKLAQLKELQNINVVDNVGLDYEDLYAQMDSLDEEIRNLSESYGGLSVEALSFLSDAANGTANLTQVAATTDEAVNTMLLEIADRLDITKEKLLELLNLKYYDGKAYTGGGTATEQARRIAGASTSDAEDWQDVYDRLLLELEGLSDEEADIWAEAVKDANNYQDAVEKGTNAVEKFREEQNKIEFEPLSIAETVDALDTRLKPAMDTLGNVYKEVLSAPNQLIDGALGNIDLIDQVKSIKDQITTLNSDKNLGISIDLDSWENLVEVLQDTSSTGEQVQEAFNDVATSLTTAGLTGAESFETMKAALGDMGVVNNEIVAFQALISNAEALKAAGLDLATASDAQITAFLNEKISAENTVEAYQMLYAVKLQEALLSINSDTDVAELERLAEAAGISASGLASLVSIKAQLAEIEARGYSNAGDRALADRLKQEADAVSAGIQARLAGVGKTKVNYAPVIKDAGKAGSEAGKEFADEFKDKLNNLISAVGDVLDAKIANVEAERDAALADIDDQIGQLDDVIGKLQDQKEELEESNKQRERAISLQKAEWELQRAMSQKTKMVNDYTPSIKTTISVKI